LIEIMSPQKIPSDTRIEGIAASPGVVKAPIHVVHREDLSIPQLPIQPDQVSDEYERFEQALVKTREQILEIQQALKSSIGERDASIFDAHLLVLEDVVLLDAVRKQLEAKLLCAEYVFHHLTQRYAQSMREVEDPYLQERATDILDVGRRVVQNLMGRQSPGRFSVPHPCIIVAHDLAPADTAQLDRSKVLGFATDMGNQVSHAAIMARGLQIPAIVGLKDASSKLRSGMNAIMDGYAGVIIINPSDQTLYRYGEMEERRHAVEEGLLELRDTKAVTTDEHEIIVSANVELPEDLPLVKQAGAEGIGLYRTEFLFMNRGEMPSEEEQYEAYRKVVEAAAPEPVIFRTLDIGGDKMLDEPQMIDELNPFLGWRAIRFSLGRKESFRAQLRAICRATHGHPARIMFPMISTYDELLEAKAILQDVRWELQAEGIEHAEEVEIGAMVEVPSAAMISDHLASQVDFLSIGTNDLIQYSLAVDRTNEMVAYLYQPTHPSILRFIDLVVKNAHEANIWVGVCGETAGDVILTPMLLGLGVDELSMGSASISRVKRAVQNLSYDEMRTKVQDWMKMASASEIHDELLTIAKQHYPELID
jgi:phosphotransferase system enzyme I (PtsI)